MIAFEKTLDGALRLAVSRKSIFDPFDSACFQPVEEDAIEAAVAFRQAHQVMTRRQDKALLFAGIHTAGSAPVLLVATQAHFDKHQHFAITANQVNLAAAHAKIALHQLEPLLLEIIGRQSFGSVAAGSALRGIVIALTHRVFNMKEDSAALYVVPTPLGNLADLSQRATATLCAVRWIAAEDTRHTAPLLKHIGATAKLIAAHEHNENEAAERIVALLTKGEAVALVSDAGTPGISDPGARIVAAVRAAGHRIVPLPGPCAATTALSAAGLPDAHFFFDGFLPVKSAQRRAALALLRDLPAALVFYEAPHRIIATVEDLASTLGETRTLVIARELTKLFESIHACPLGEAAAWLRADPNRQKGEFVLIVSGAPASQESDLSEAERVLELLLAEGLPVKQAARLATAITDVSRNELYRLALAWKERASS